MATTKAWSHLALSLFAAVAAQAALPEPPQQHQPWIKPSAAGIPDYVMAATALLFDAGLADPRGGSYREIELASVRTHGWVFSEKYAVCWDGLVYPVRSLGPAADLNQDVRAIAAAAPWSSTLFFRGEPSKTRADAFWFDMDRGVPIAPTSIALLFRLGRPDLAAQLWGASETPDMWGTVRQHEANQAAWAPTAARAWIGAAFWRLTGARDRNDDQDAVDVAESLLTWKASVPSGSLTSLSFLEPVPILLADSERRLHEPARPHVDFSTDDNGKHTPAYAVFLERPQATRIADLIDRLEDVRAEKTTIPGSLEFSFDPICELLTKEGEAAVDALLDVYEHDQRLTRTLDYVRPWYLERTPIPVSNVAKIILSDILKSKDLSDGYSPASVRVWWQKHKTSSLAERNLEILADDHASAERWLESVHFITLRSDVKLANGGSMTEGEGCSPQKEAPAVYGEELRTRPGPSVSELLFKRVTALTNSKSEAACRMAFMAFLWEPNTSLPVLQKASNLEECRADSRMTAARMSLGDFEAAVDWSAIIMEKAAKPGVQISELAPLWMFPDDPTLSETAEWLFTRNESLLSPAVNFLRIHSPLLTLQAYRRAIVSALNDDSFAGKAARSPDGSLSWTLKDGSAGASNALVKDPKQAPPGQVLLIRMKDLAALGLSFLEGAPEFELDWPEFDKDAAIAKIKEYLKVHEKELRAFPAKPQELSCPRESVYLKR